MDRWTRTTQDTTTITADNHGERYTAEEIEMIVGFGDEPMPDLAVMMGRTYFAISTMKGLIAAGKVAAPAVAASDKPYRGFMEGDEDDE